MGASLAKEQSRPGNHGGVWGELRDEDHDEFDEDSDAIYAKYA